MKDSRCISGYQNELYNIHHFDKGSITGDGYFETFRTLKYYYLQVFINSLIRIFGHYDSFWICDMDKKSQKLYSERLRKGSERFRKSSEKVQKRCWIVVGYHDSKQRAPNLPYHTWHHHHPEEPLKKVTNAIHLYGSDKFLHGNRRRFISILREAW